MTQNNEKTTDIGVPYGSAIPIHIEGLYNIQNRIASIIEFGSTTGNKVNYDGVKALVELAISSIPDHEQATTLREIMEKKEKERIKEIAEEKGHNIPTADDEQQAMRETSFCVFNLVHRIYDDDTAIRSRFTIGFA